MHRAVVPGLLMACTSVAWGQGLVSIEIVGPTEVMEQSETQYQAIAHFDDMDLDVTGEADWAVEPSLVATIDQGLLTVGNLKTDVVLLVSASYASGNVEVDTSLEISAIPTDVTKIAKLGASDAEYENQFGSSVAFGDGVLLVGANGDGDNNSLAGSAYLFDVTHPSQIVQLSKLLSADGHAQDGFGTSVGVDGATAIIGALWNGENGNDAGAAYLFDVSDPASPMQLAKLLAADGEAGDWFGRSVGVDSGLAVVGSPQDDDLGLESGSAYVFDVQDPGSPVQVAKVLPSDGSTHARFGWAIALRGTTLVVGAPFDSDERGAAYVFDLSDPADPVEVAKLAAADSEPSDRVGDSVAIGDLVVAAGAPFDDDQGSQSGSAYLFDVVTGEELAKVLPDDGGPMSRFGGSMAIDAETLVVGAYWDDDHGIESGSAYLFDIADATRPQQTHKILPDMYSSGEEFGRSVAKADALIAAGATSFPGKGSVYVYRVGATCAPDINGDGRLDILDFVSFQLSWVAGISVADCNGDGELTVLDFVCYQAMFEGGCE